MKKKNYLDLGLLNQILVVSSVLLMVFSVYAMVQLLGRYDDTVDSAENYISARNAVMELNEASDYLTEQSREYVVTGDPACANNYFREVNDTKRRENALKSLSDYQQNEDTEAYEELERAMTYSVDLEGTELRAMSLYASAAGETGDSELPDELKETILSSEDAALTPDEKKAEALDLLFGKEYSIDKDSISKSINEASETILDVLKSDQNRSMEQFKQARVNFFVAFMALFMINLMTILSIHFLVLRPVKSFERSISNGEQMETVGSREFRYLAESYNQAYALQRLNMEALRKEAEHDALTGILNRGSYEKIKQQMKGTDIHMALVLADVDRFKEVNDNYGHEMGDKILGKLAMLLKKNFRSEDYCFRTGGDEFVVIATGVTEDDAENVRGKMELVNRELKDVSDGTVAASVSVGAAFSRDGYSDELFREADAALYRSKENGRGMLTFKWEQ